MLRPLLLTAALSWTVLTAGQTPGRFEVASIKPSDPNARLTLSPELKHGTLRGSNITLKHLLAVAYGVTDPRVIGPAWLAKERFDIVAKAPEGVPDTEMKPLLQALLAERFRLAAHTEAREMAAYDLVIAKGGPKMPVAPNNAGQRPTASGYPMVRMSGTTDRLAAILTTFVDRPVVDKTGLTQRYEIFLSFSLPSVRNMTESAPPDLFTAIKEQLGLMLKATKTSLGVVVVDHIERTPSAN